MSEQLAPELPARLQEALNGEDLEQKVGPIYQLVTIDPDGAPRSCMLSAGEVLAPDNKRVRLALWPGTNTSANLFHGGRALICFIDADYVIYVKGTARKLDPRAPVIERFEIAVESVESDVHEGLPVVAGPAFMCPPENLEAMLSDWARKISALREP